MKKEFKNIGLDLEILRAVENLGFQELTEIQEKVALPALEGKNILGSSSTGSGKTLAFLMPILQRTSFDETKASTLILAPSRELALQIQNEYNTLGRYKKLSSVAVFGKQPMKDQVAEMKNRHQAISGTPGRVLDHIKKGTIDTAAITCLVIDEVDELLDRGFTEEVTEIVSSLQNITQTMMFSATITEKVKDLALKITDNFTLVEAEKDEDLNIEEVHYRVPASDKWKALVSLIYGRKPRSMIIFVNTKDECDRLQQKLEDTNIDALKIHGGLQQEDRLKAMERFKNKEVPYLVATDVAARGIDISDLDISLSYDFPVEKESYVHRKGRTGRNFKEGLAVYFITEYDDRKVSTVEEYIGHGLGEMKTPDFGPLRTEKDAFREFQKSLRKMKHQKTVIHKDITKLYVNGGKNKKIRALDIAGALNAVEGIEPEDIGIIKVMDQGSYIDILNGKGDMAMKGLSEAKVKGKVLRVELAKK